MKRLNYFGFLALFFGVLSCGVFGNEVTIGEVAIGEFTNNSELGNGFPVTVILDDGSKDLQEVELFVQMANSSSVGAVVINKDKDIIVFPHGMNETASYHCFNMNGKFLYSVQNVASNVRESLLDDEGNIDLLMLGNITKEHLLTNILDPNNGSEDSTFNCNRRTFAFLAIGTCVAAAMLGYAGYQYSKEKKAADQEDEDFAV